jgi:hypothetical protein
VCTCGDEEGSRLELCFHEGCSSNGGERSRGVSGTGEVTTIEMPCTRRGGMGGLNQGQMVD